MPSPIYVDAHEETKARLREVWAGAYLAARSGSHEDAQMRDEAMISANNFLEGCFRGRTEFIHVGTVIAEMEAGKEMLV